MASPQTAAGEQPQAGSQDPPAGTAQEQPAELSAPGTQAQEPSAREARRARPLRRRPERGMLGGVCAGLAEHFGVDPLVVRVLTALVIVVGGIGVAIYALAWALIPVAQESRGLARPPGAWRQAVLIVFAVAGLAIGLRLLGLGLADSVIWPLVLGVCGLALVWRPAIDTTKSSGGRRGLSPRELLRGSEKADAPRLILGSLLVAFASASLLHLLGVLHSVGAGFGAVAIIATVLGLLFGPWFVRMGRSLAFERAARIREQERAELAAHLHDSVLQTLALIQKRAGDPREVAGLARRQERELRRWLHERPAVSGQESVATALEHAAAEVEELHRVPIEVVTVGDGPLDGRLEALVQAAREALTNAAKFAASERVDLFAEVDADRVEVFVRDRGVGFDPAAIPPDRRGVRDSIIGRMERHRGRAAVNSTPGAGTEVELVMDRGLLDMSGQPRVVIVDDHHLFRAGVRTELGHELAVVGDAGGVGEAVELIRAQQPDVVLVDVHMPDGGGVELINRVSGDQPTVRFLALSVSDAAEDVIAVIRAGARGYVTKTISGPELADAVRRVAGGDAVFSPRLAGFVLDAFAGEPAPSDDRELEQLTPREREVLRHIARGYMYKEIAQRLGISVKTVEAHVSAVLRKLQLSSRHELSRWAVERRLVSFDGP